MGRLGMALTRERMATGVSSKREERQRVVAAYRAARRTYQEATAHLVQLEDARAGSVAGIAEDKANKEGFDAGWLPLLSGKNETERKADLQRYRDASEEYHGCSQRIAFEERRIKIELEPEIARVTWEIKGARYDMELCIAEGLMIASEKDDERHG